MILETNRLAKDFGGQAAVADLSMHIPQGCVYGLLGPNGAGKTTTLKMLTGLLRPSSGTISINGSPWRREHLDEIGSLIETPALYGNLTARENLLVHTRLMRLPNDAIDEALSIVNLTDTGSKRSGRFSLGMKQRLGIAIALLGNPRIVILDEPTNGLDPLGIQELRELVRSFPQRGITVILSSHLLSEVEQVADIVGIVDKGRLRYEGRVSECGNLEQLFMSVVRQEVFS